MSETLAKPRRIAERVPSRYNLRLDSVSRPCDGHECPSYIRSFRHRHSPDPHCESEKTMKTIEAAGFDNLHFAYYGNMDVGNDGVWDICGASNIRY